MMLRRYYSLKVNTTHHHKRHCFARAYQLAYGNETLGAQSTITDPSILQNNHRQFVQLSSSYVHPSNMTLAMVGLKHEDALKLGAELFGDIPSQPTYQKKLQLIKQTSLFVCLKHCQ